MGSCGVTERESDYGLDLLGMVVDQKLKEIDFEYFNLPEIKEFLKQAILDEIEHFIQNPISERELQKVINKTEARISYSEINYQGKSANLAFFDYLGNIDLINQECARYAQISVETIKATAQNMFKPENCSTLWYLKNNI